MPFQRASGVLVGLRGGVLARRGDCRIVCGEKGKDVKVLGWVGLEDVQFRGVLGMGVITHRLI